MKKIAYSFILFLAIITLSSCTSNKQATNNGFNTGGPKWTQITAGAYTVNGGKVLRAVGISEDWGDVSTTMDAAHNNAYANLSYYMKTYVNALRASYKKSHTANGKVDYERTLTHMSESLTNYQFSGGKFIKKWKSPTNQVYVLLEIKLEIVDSVLEKSAIQQAEKVGGEKPDLDAIRRRSADAHARLDAATDDLDF